MEITKLFFTCPIRTLEAERLSNYLESKNDNYTLIGSCVVTKEVEQMVIDVIKSQNSKILVYGCISEKIKSIIDQKNNIDYITTIEFNKKLNSPVNSELQNSSPCFILKSDSLCNRNYEDIAKNEESFLRKLFGKRKTVPFLVIANGCNNNCSYCHTKFYIGNLLSKQQGQIVEEYLLLARKNYDFINIIAEDIGSYGIDINTDLPSLLFQLDKIYTKRKIRWMLDGLHPKWAIKYEKELSQLISSNRISAMSIPVQSGNNRILKLMNRNHDRELSINVLNNFRKLNPKLYLQGIFIIGFPSETEQEFMESIDYIKTVNFNDVTLIPYSEFLICKSAQINDKIPQEIIYERINKAKKNLKQCKINIRD